MSQGHARHARLSWIQTTSRTVDKRRLSRKPTVGKGSSMQTVTERHPTEQTRLYKVTRLKKKATCQQETRYSQQGYQSRTLAVKTCDAKPAVRRETAPQHSGTRRLPAPPPLQNLTRSGPDLRMLATNITQTTMGWRQKSLPEVKPEDSPARGDGTAALLNLWSQGHSTMGDQGNQPTGHRTAALRGMWATARA